MEITKTDDAKTRILKAAVIEFSDKGYEKGSTNTIAKTAGAAKGLIFKYYKDKLTLLLRAIDYAIDVYMAAYSAEAANFKPEREFYKRITQNTAIKLRLIQTESHCSELITKSYLSKDDFIKGYVGKKIASITPDAMALMFKDLDLSQFREDLTKEEIIQYITMFSWLLVEKYHGYFDSVKDYLSIYDFLSDKIYRDFDILLNGIYKR